MVSHLWFTVAFAWDMQDFFRLHHKIAHRFKPAIHYIYIYIYRTHRMKTNEHNWSDSNQNCSNSSLVHFSLVPSNLEFSLFGESILNQAVHCRFRWRICRRINEQCHHRLSRCSCLSTQLLLTEWLDFLRPCYYYSNSLIFNILTHLSS